MQHNYMKQYFEKAYLNCFIQFSNIGNVRLVLIGELQMKIPLDSQNNCQKSGKEVENQGKSGKRGKIGKN